MFLAACATVYVAPTDGDPHAQIRYRRVYDRTAGPSLRENLTIDGHVAYAATSDAALVQAPRVDGVLVHAAPATFTSSAKFFHVETRMAAEVYSVSEPYQVTKWSMCGFGTSSHPCSRRVTLHRQVSRTRSVLRTVEVPDAVCSGAVRFLPANNASYLLEFNFKETNVCSLSCFEQVAGANGELENRACPVAPPPPPPPRDRKSTRLN